MQKNIILIGMPGSGKSTIGVLLAKALNYKFIDGDLLIQQWEKKTLIEIIRGKGIDEFLSIENQVLSKIEAEQTVIATGGSAVFSSEAMKHLGENGIIVYLKVGCAEIIRRVSNISTRGIAMKPGSTMEDLYAERTPYYEHYAQLTVHCDGKSMEEIVQILVQTLRIKINKTRDTIPKKE